MELAKHMDHCPVMRSRGTPKLWAAVWLAALVLLQFDWRDRAMNAQEPTASTRLNREIQGILIAAFPELRSGRLTWSLEVDKDRATVHVVPASELLRGPSSSPPRQLLSAEIAIDLTGRVAQLSTSGVLVGTERLDTLRMEALSQSETYIRGRLQSSGAAFFPRTAPSPAPILVSEGLARALSVGSVSDARFLYSSQSPDLLLTWEVQGQPAQGTASPTTVNFEPFSGRLVSVVR